MAAVKTEKPLAENFFDLFGFVPSFSVDSKMVEARYFEMQRRFHPDRYAGRPQSERLAALQKATLINEAYQTLKDPLKRAEYLLRLKGVDMGQPDPSILTEAMEHREELAETTDKEGMSILYGKAQQEQKNCLERLKEYFFAEAYDKAAYQTLRLKYLVKWLDEIRLRQHNN